MWCEVYDFPIVRDPKLNNMDAYDAYIRETSKLK